MKGRWWRSYKHRFTPWLALNWSTRQVKRTDAKLNAVKEKRAITQLSFLMQALDVALPRYTVKEYRTLLRKPDELHTFHVKGMKVMADVFGFSVEVGRSRLEGGGRGVLVTGGRVPLGHLVGIYPGTVYLPHEPLFFQSLWNPFIFRCADGVMIDGNHRGLSKWIYKSCAYRDAVGGSVVCDITWLSMLPYNPLAVGQFVNNHTREIASNVEYAEVTLASHHHLRFIPNTYYGTTPDWNGQADGNMRCVVLMSTRDIEIGEELYSSYLTLVHNEKYNQT